jgi:hypothetical protein
MFVFGAMIRALYLRKLLWPGESDESSSRERGGWRGLRGEIGIM